jgi:hypothetical protein
VNGISVKGDVVDDKLDTTKTLLTHRALVTGPLEPTNDGILDLVKVSNARGLLNDDVRTDKIVTEAPDLGGCSSLLPTEGRVLAKKLGALFDIHIRSEDTLIEKLAYIAVDRLSDAVKAVVFVGRLGEALLGGWGGDTLIVSDNRRGNIQRSTFHKVLCKIL